VSVAPLSVRRSDRPGQRLVVRRWRDDHRPGKWVGIRPEADCNLACVLTPRIAFAISLLLPYAPCTRPRLARRHDKTAWMSLIGEGLIPGARGWWVSVAMRRVVLQIGSPPNFWVAGLVNKRSTLSAKMVRQMRRQFRKILAQSGEGRGVSCPQALQCYLSV
jgi:hypothetical protein